MISVKGKYENGRIELNQLPKIQSNTNVIVTFLEEEANIILDEDYFWELIDLIDWNQETDSKILSPLLDGLVSLSSENISKFKEILSEKLFRLDTKEHARYIGDDSYTEKSSSFSPDIFLFTRALVVAKGKDFYSRVLFNPKLMPKNSDFEAILYLPAEAYKIKTGKEMNYVPKYIPETFSNSNGWDGDFDLKKMVFGEK
ncbi:MAG: DUF4240 domain-containing protein [Leptospiraceae bacterium]|nr:DUF4240 domain-containing protein [Leptospiraceae bacterium]